MTPKADAGSPTPQVRDPGESATGSGHKGSENSIDQIPLLDSQSHGLTGADDAATYGVRERK